LPWSPLATGSLTGKYINGTRPKGSRWSYAQRNGLFRDTEEAELAVKAYLDIANKYDMTAAQLALAWVNQVDGVTSTIIGATSLTQLQENIQAFDIKFTEEMAVDINETLKRFPAPF
ncbi:MAG: aldo/keto reductase, partial [Gammaproteobacteria bacterium]|nr:aldo/keto reductase [Gammaproteobacteria bacterium]